MSRFCRVIGNQGSSFFFREEGREREGEVVIEILWSEQEEAGEGERGKWCRKEGRGESAGGKEGERERGGEGSAVAR